MNKTEWQQRTGKTNEFNKEAEEGNFELLAAITWPFAFLLNSKRDYNVKAQFTLYLSNLEGQS